MKSDTDYDALAAAVVGKLIEKVPDLVLATLGALEANRRAQLDAEQRRVVEAQQRRDAGMVRQSIEEHKSEVEAQRRAKERAAFPDSAEWGMLNPLEQRRFLEGHEPPADLDERRRVWLEVKKSNPNHIAVRELGMVLFVLTPEERTAWDDRRELPGAFELTQRIREAKKKLNVGRF